LAFLSAVHSVLAFIPLLQHGAFRKGNIRYSSFERQINFERQFSFQPLLFVRPKSFATVLFSTDNDEEFISAEDLEKLQSLFGSSCDSDGLMNKAAVMRVPVIAQLLVSSVVCCPETTTQHHVQEEDNFALELLHDNAG
jgi:hypothetical protein